MSSADTDILLQPTIRESLPDCASEKDSRSLPIQEVGISGLSYPISVWDRSGKLQHTQP